MATDLIADQYVDRLQLRPILDVTVDAARACGPVVIQARKAFVAHMRKTRERERGRRRR